MLRMMTSLLLILIVGGCGTLAGNSGAPRGEQGELGETLETSDETCVPMPEDWEN